MDALQIRSVLFLGLLPLTMLACPPGSYTGQVPPKTVLWPLQPHTAAKHRILRAYLGGWFPILSWNGRIGFIDGFAGPGEYASGEPGSPMIALDVALKHQADLSKCELVFLFIEQDRARHAHLQTKVRELVKSGRVPNHVKLQTLQGAFDQHMTAVLDSLGDSGMAPAFVMIDPFGVAGVPYDIVRRLGEHPRTELLISFMYEGMSRFLGSQEFEEHLDELFGCPDWRGALSLSGASGRQYLHDLYEQRLKEAGYPLVRSFELLDDGNRTEYFLMFATKHPKGIEVMKDAMWKVDPDGTYRFSDATNPHQQTLFSSEPDYEQLARFVFENFAEQTANVTRIEEWTVINTAFRRAHLRKALRLLEERQQIVRVTGRQKRLTYPKGCQIQLARLD